METYSICRDLAIIIIAAKFCAIVARKCKAPQVVGQIIAGLLIGPSVLGLVTIGDTAAGAVDPLSVIAEIGVILLMFSAGLETDMKELIKTGPVATLIACAGVAIPLVGGTVLYECFYGFSPIGSEEFLSAVFIGTIMTATSVSITVQSLRELGHLKGKVGTTILSAAIIDDVIGIIVLTIVVGFKDPANNPARVLISTVLFFVFAIIVGIVTYKIIKWMDSRYPRTRRIPIIGLALCFSMAFIAEKYFGIADITGAYVAGIILCNLNDSEYIETKVDINSYMIFGPVFFASIGLKTSLNSVSWGILAFSIMFVVVALVCKIIGCGLMARLCHFNWPDSLKIGVGMMTRGEVALIVAQKGLAVGMISSVYFTAVILLIMFSSILTPIILKVLYAKDPIEV
ncbi:MAG: cation:proton antiporter [Lachnospiraceae bacterium]|nr:cation:proton antiporter [Lachnospiraceae bacterium]